MNEKFCIIIMNVNVLHTLCRVSTFNEKKILLLILLLFYESLDNSPCHSKRKEVVCSENIYVKRGERERREHGSYKFSPCTGSNTEGGFGMVYHTPHFRSLYYCGSSSQSAFYLYILL
jgi:hypothetical protein